MRWLRKLARRVVAMLRPWPGRNERHAAIAAATAEKERSQAAADHARTLEQQIQHMAKENHFAARIAGQIIRGHE